MDRKVLETGNFRFSNGYFPLDSDATNVSVDVTTKNKTLAGAWAGGTGYDTE